MLALSLLWRPELRRLNLLVGVILVLTFAIPLAHRATQAMILLLEPEAGHEYADNRSIGEALAKIPLSGTVIVTNDLRYPANDFARDNRQMQIPALFGHQAYAANTRYELYPDSGRRVAVQERFAAPVWDPALSSIARQEGWTHLLVHKGAPHPQAIPLNRAFENQHYIIYEFD